MSTASTEPAGLGRRLGAALYDGLLLLALWFFATLALMPFTGGAIPPGDLRYEAYLVAVGGLFFVYFWSRGGQTLGMRAWRLRLVGPDGRPPRAGRAACRYLLAWLSWGLGGLGILWVLVDRERRAWHDLACGTRVLRLPKGGLSARP
ncbi:RDD family protein [Inmirania thermothiophila]|uniref:Putative RDD family membrane protein YckC n=1 Tax=Inmirania thermothiophila TaxID=1750597 RepID=A0A3N1Y307_9GAMM|nr:RDD family protein [Inmirania thermothiophila]ROR32888.1 putative RDD family membrane protein YckC [Inmirania thermothiophila]